ncbi:methyltransferase domain-containing protein [Streptomyces sp. NPDC088847]|uniref:methyltransferase domain-containing protein n=1 Tax=Streptomyces sp. NPDC088847 TaxID=3365909 RepID=UPI0038008C0A
MPLRLAAGSVPAALTTCSPSLPDEALRRAQAAAPRSNLSYARWDSVADPITRRLAPGSLDVVTCRYGLPFLEPGRLLTDVGRWLKPDGVFYALVHVGAGADRDVAERQVRGNRDHGCGLVRSRTRGRRAQHDRCQLGAARGASSRRR